MFCILLRKERIKVVLLQIHINLNFRELSPCSGALTRREPFPRRVLEPEGSGRTEHPGALGEAVKPSTGVRCSDQVRMRDPSQTAHTPIYGQKYERREHLCARKALLRKQKGVRCTIPKAPQVSTLNLCPWLHAYQQGPQCTPKTTDSCKGNIPYFPGPGGKEAGRSEM